MYKPIKRLYFWLKSKVYKMSNKLILNELQEKINSMLQIFHSEFSSEDYNGYLFKEDETENSFDFKIGLEKFTLCWFFNLEKRVIMFKTYYWEFNPNAPNNKEKKYIKGFDMVIKNNSYVYFIQILNDEHNPKNIKDFPIIYIKELESFVNRKNNNEFMEWESRLLLNKG